MVGLVLNARKRKEIEMTHTEFDALLSKFTGVKFDSCKTCGELLGHRKDGSTLPCTTCKK